MATSPDAQLTIEEKFLTILSKVKDPELPFLSVLDLGMIRECSMAADGQKLVQIKITPTYSGCPAFVSIQESLKKTFYCEGYFKLDIKQVLSPVWSSDDITETGRQKMKAHGIAAPQQGATGARACPYCEATKIKVLSEFGSTLCKSLYLCQACGMAFDHFKCFPRKFFVKTAQA